MSDDWVKNYIQTRENKQRKADLAKAGALGVFQKIEERIKRDLQEFHDSGLFLNLYFSPGSHAGRFGVELSGYSPQALLGASLNVVLIQCSYVPKKGNQSKPYTATLKVCADLDGTMLIYKDGELLGDESDLSRVSEHILQPLLKVAEE